MGTLEDLYDHAGAALAALGAQLTGEKAAGIRLRDDAVVAVLGGAWPPRREDHVERRVRAHMRRHAPVQQTPADGEETMLVGGRS
ncbi:hypothetical protein [Demequina lignilytica]|uniref:Uncharacterized protein n=1 Tax=Demequina lignilytica TaxID=3051663 RepID=A0AB35MJ98_9MICO|nr:hypothetical protein [Demequina sp. SYSU T0a273]MDN4483859.1 hypothetical protein [Demequina sp. SYSU T0a273]